MLLLPEIACDCTMPRLAPGDPHDPSTRRPPASRRCPLDEIDAEIRERIGDGPVLNIFRTLAQHPKLMKRWLVFGNHVLGRSSLPAREREIVILRIGWLCRSAYEWGQHVRMALGAGLSQAEIDSIPLGRRRRGAWSESGARAAARHRRAARRRLHLATRPGPRSPSTSTRTS